MADSTILSESRLAEIRTNAYLMDQAIFRDLLASHDALTALFEGINLHGDCLICTDSTADHDKGTAGCPCCWSAPKRTLQDVMQWNYDCGEMRAKAEQDAVAFNALADGIKERDRVLRLLVESLRGGFTGDDQSDWCVAGCGRIPDEVWNSDWQHQPDCPFIQAKNLITP